MNPAWRQMHTVAGVMFGMLLFAIMLTGSISVFDPEIGHWSRASSHGADPAGGPTLERAVAHLSEVAPDARAWWISPPDARTPAMRLRWVARNGERTEAYYSPAMDDFLPVSSVAGNFFSRFHTRLDMGRTGIWIVGISAMALLLALVSGFYIHRKKWRELMTFRPGKSANRALLDTHNAVGMLTLPFQFMIAYSGLVIFWSIYMPTGLLAAFPDDPGAFRQEGFQIYQRPASGTPATLMALAPLVDKARARWPEADAMPDLLRINHPADGAAVVEIRRRMGQRVAHYQHTLYYDGITGELLFEQAAPAAYYAQRLLRGLHQAHYGGSVVRWAYLLLGLAGTLLIGTGLLLWGRRSMPRHPLLAHSLGAISITGTTGLLVAVAALLAAMRLLPGDIDARVTMEQRIFYTVWGLSLLHALIPISYDHRLRQQVATAGGVMTALPIAHWLSMPGTQAPFGIDNVADAVNATLLAGGSLLMACAYGSRFVPPARRPAP